MEEARAAHPSFWAHAVAWLPVAGVWLICRSSSLSTRTIQVVEGTGLVLTSVCLVVMGAYLPAAAGAATTTAYALSFGLIARAIFVPSTASRILLGMRTLRGMLPIIHRSMRACWRAGPFDDALAPRARAVAQEGRDAFRVDASGSTVDSARMGSNAHGGHFWPRPRYRQLILHGARNASPSASTSEVTTRPRLQGGSPPKGQQR